ncbi:MAG: TolC family protein [bacterium]
MKSRKTWYKWSVMSLVMLTLVWGSVMAYGQDRTTAVAARETPGTPVLDLQRCVQIALESSYALAISSEQREQAAQGVRQAKGSFLPDLNLSRTDVRDRRTDFDVDQYGFDTVNLITQEGIDIPYHIPTTLLGTADEETRTTYQDYQASTNLDVFSGFSKFSGLKSARAELNAADATVLYDRELVARNVASAYYNLLRYERLLEVANDSRELAFQELKRSETRYNLGSDTKSDVLQARVRHEQTRLGVVQAENSVAQAFADLAYAMNQPLAGRFEIDRSPLETDFEIEDLETLFSEAMTNRHDLQSQEYRVKARQQDVTTAAANLWPSLSVFAQYSYNSNESPYRFGAQTSDLLRYGYQVRWAVFDRLVTWSQRSTAKANARIAEYTLEQARLDAQLEIRRLYNTLVEASERVKVNRETIQQAMEELRLAQERLKVGAGTTLDRINAEVNLASARADEVQATCDFLIAGVELKVAVGRASELLAGAGL